LIIQSKTSELLALSRKLLNEESSVVDDEIGVVLKTCNMNMMIKKWKHLKEQDMACFVLFCFVVDDELNCSKWLALQ
jgi:hypothetical protein